MSRKIADSPKNSHPPDRSPHSDRPLAAAAFLALTAPILAHLLFTPKFQTNDDACINMIACGAGICDRPEPHLLYINFLIGKLLEWLYHEYPDAPWYRLFMITSQFGASVRASRHSRLCE